MIETAEMFGKDVAEFVRLPAEYRAEMMAYSLAKAIRAGYESEKIRDEHKPDAKFSGDGHRKPGFNPMEMQRRRWLI